MSVNKALRHDWFCEVKLREFNLTFLSIFNSIFIFFEDFDLFCDLQDLEKRANQSWLLSDELKEKWKDSVQL
jgi:hypothetical protein